MLQLVVRLSPLCHRLLITSRSSFAHRISTQRVFCTSRPFIAHHLSTARYASTTSTTTTTPETVVGAKSESLVQGMIALSRISTPRPALLLMWPCYWAAGMACAPGTLPDLLLLSKFAFGALVMRGAGCTINDILDRDFDRHVDRTKGRPLAIEGGMSTRHAIQFLAGQLSVGLGLLLTFDNYSIVVGASSMVLVCIYPLMKRFFHWPQLVLGMAFNWGALIGWSAVQGSCNWPACLLLYTSGISWTLVYDTIYAHMDKADDSRLGLRSTALYFGDHYARPILGALAVSSVSLLAAAGVVANMSPVFYGVSVGGAAAHLAYQVATVDIDSRESCMATFMSNTTLGGIVAAGIFLDRILAI